MTAAGDDGLAEAIELTERPVLGVQRELQEEYRIDRRFLAVFEWFVEAAPPRARLGRVV